MLGRVTCTDSKIMYTRLQVKKMRFSSVPLSAVYMQQKPRAVSTSGCYTSRGGSADAVLYIYVCVLNAELFVSMSL
jgi:hypothetical protein